MLTYALLAFAGLTTAQAQDCNAKELLSQLEEAVPATRARIYVKLAKCDPERARKAANTYMQTMLSDEEAVPALVAAIKLGATEDVQRWLAAQEPDARSRMINKVGNACTKVPEVGDFFAESYKVIGNRFWDERWHRGLAECRTPTVQALLKDALDSDAVGRTSGNRTQFSSVLEVYARNLGADALPTLEDYLSTAKDDQEAALLVNTFSDASNVGSAEGVNPETSKRAIAIIENLAPQLAPRALERARATFKALGAETAARRLARHLYADRYVDGQYTYGVAAVELITCKNDQKRAVLHLGSITEPGEHWPDQVRDRFEEKIMSAWNPNNAAKCKGTAKIDYRFSLEPTAGAEGLNAWYDTMRKDFSDLTRDASKTWTVDHTPIAW